MMVIFGNTFAMHRPMNVKHISMLYEPWCTTDYLLH